MDLSVRRVPGMKNWNITVKQAPCGAIPIQHQQLQNIFSIGIVNYTYNQTWQLRIEMKEGGASGEHTIEGTIWLGQMTLQTLR